MYKDDSLYNSSGLRALFNGTVMIVHESLQMGLKSQIYNTKLHQQSDKIIMVIERDMKMVEPSDWDLLLELIKGNYC